MGWATSFASRTMRWLSDSGRPAEGVLMTKSRAQRALAILLLLTLCAVVVPGCNPGTQQAGTTAGKEVAKRGFLGACGLGGGYKACQEGEYCP